MNKHRIHIILKNGREIIMECDTFKVKRNPFTGKIEAAEWTGADLTQPLYIDLSDISAILRTDPNKEEDHEKR